MKTEELVNALRVLRESLSAYSKADNTPCILVHAMMIEVLSKDGEVLVETNDLEEAAEVIHKQL